LRCAFGVSTLLATNFFEAEPHFGEGTQCGYTSAGQSGMPIQGRRCERRAVVSDTQVGSNVVYFGILVSQVRSAEERGTPLGNMMSPDTKRPHRFAVFWRSIKGVFA
jgi:hypothetical protein